ncbi:MAG: SMC family ATPase [Nitrosopumilus sp.]|nr:SMC family ATPase [Nitrosopumilus sp.]
MILERLDLENIRSWKSSSITFPEGITLFEGEIGSGKSSLLMGIEFALFGYGKAESLLSKKAHEGSATLFFSVDGKKYEVRRVLERKKGKVGQNSRGSYIVEDGEKVPLSASELKQRVLHILRFNENPRPNANSRIYRYAVFTPQEEMKVILADDKTRFEAIRRAFGVEDYACAVTNSALISSRIRDKARALAGMFSGLEEAKTRLKEAEREAGSGASGIKDLEAGAESARKRHDIAKQRLKEAGERCSRMAGLATDLRNAEERMESGGAGARRHEEQAADEEEQVARSRKELEAIPSNPPSDTSSSEIASRLKSVEGALRARDTAAARYEECRRMAEDDDLPDGAESARERAAGAAAGIGDKREEIRAARSTMDGLVKEATEKRARAGTIREDLREIEKLGDQCPTCKQPIDIKSTASIKNKKAEEIKRLDEEAEKMDVRISACREEIKELDRMVTGLADEKTEYEVLASRVDARKKAVMEMESSKKTADGAAAEYSRMAASYGLGDDPVGELGRARDAMAEYEKAQVRAEGLEDTIRARDEAAASHRAEAARLRKDAEEAGAEIDGIRSKMEGFEGAEGERDDAEAEEQEASREVVDVSSRLATAREALKGAERRIKEYGEAVAEGKKRKEEHDRLGGHAGWLDDYFEKSARIIEQEVLTSTRQEFDARYREIYAALIDDPSKESRIDEDFGPLVSQDGIEQDLQYMSGGEKSSIALAYRLTINTMLRRSIDTLKSNLLILDEPTDGFSKAQLAKVRGVLDGLGSQQVILVSHDSELEAYADHVFRVSKEGGASSISDPNQ